MTEEDFLALTNPPKVEEVRKAKKYVVNGKKTYFLVSMQKRVRKAAAKA